MGMYLDIDDGCYGNPVAEKELKQLREMERLVEGMKFELLPACSDALNAIDKCFSEDGYRCLPSTGDFVMVENAKIIVGEFKKRVEEA